MTVSVILLARGHSSVFAGQLRGLQRFMDSQSDAEVLIVSQDGCIKVVESEVSTQNFPVKHLRLAASGGAEARNLAACEARGGLLFFLDGQTQPTPELVEWHCERYQKQCVVVSFPALIRSSNPALRASMEFLACSNSYAERRSAGHRFGYRDFRDCSMLIARDVFQSTAGFDPAAEPLEYAELGLRLLKSGIRPLCVPYPSGSRHMESESADWRARIRAEARAAITIGNRHTETRPELWWLTDPDNIRARKVYNFAFSKNKTVERLLNARLDLFDRFRLRARWPRAFQSVWEYSFATGIAEAFGDWSTFTNWLQDGPAPPMVAPDVPLLNIDDPLSDRAGDDLVPRNCNNGVRVAIRGVEIGVIAPLAGAESLRWNHVLRWVDETLRNPASALVHPVRDSSGFLPSAQFTIELGDLNRSLYIDPRHGRLDVLVCSKGRPLTSVSLPCESSDRLVTPEQLRREVVQRGWDPCRDWSEEFVDGAGTYEFPTISVVVCTRDRPASLRNCLEHLAALSYPEFEVVVVDNASRSPEIRDIVIQSGFRYVRENRPGLDWARNRGMYEARYGIIAYTDDDACVSAGWLRGIAQAFRDPAVSAVTGLVLPLEIETRAQALFEEYGGMGKGLLPQVFDVTCRNEFEITAAALCGVGANMAFRREVLEQIGCFDTALDVGTPSFGCGDLDIFHRIVASGRTLVYEPAAWIRHRHRRDMAALERQFYSNGRSFWVYLTKIWNVRTVRRSACAQVAHWWIVRWLTVRFLNRLRSRHGFPLRLICAEILGTIHGPWAYRETYRRDRELRSTESALAQVKSFETAG